MPRIFDEFLDEHAVVAEARLRFRHRGQETFADLIGRAGDAHALAAAAGACLDHDGVADVVRDVDRLTRAFDHAEIAGHRRDASGGCRLLALDLVAHRFDGRNIGADEDDASLLQRFGKRRILRQKAVARMDRLRTGLLRRLDDLLHDKIGLRGGRWPDMDGLIRHFDMHRVAVGLRVHGHRLDAHPLRGLDDPAGNFATVCDEDFLEHDGASWFASKLIAWFALLYSRAPRASMLLTWCYGRVCATVMARIRAAGRHAPETARYPFICFCRADSQGSRRRSRPNRL